MSETHVLEPRVQYGDISGAAKADWADSIGGVFGLLEHRGLEKDRYDGIAIECWAGENAWGDPEPSIQLSIYARDKQDPEPGHVVRFTWGITPLEFFWFFKRFSLVLNEMFNTVTDEVVVTRTEEL